MGISAVNQALPVSMLSSCRCKWRRHQTHLIHRIKAPLAENQRGQLSGSCDQRAATTKCLYYSIEQRNSTIIVLCHCTVPSLFPESVMPPPTASVDWDGLVSHNVFHLGQRQYPMEMVTNGWAYRCWSLYFHEGINKWKWKNPSGDLIINTIRLHMKNVFSQ